MNEVKKLYVAMVTPFNQFNRIDYHACCRLIEYVIKEGVEGLVVCGTTGEASTLSQKEKLDLLQFVLKIVHGRIPVWMGCGSNDTNATIQFAKRIEQEEVAGIMCVTPYYNRPSQEGLYQHFKEIANEVTVPIMIYNVPKRTGVELCSDTIIRLVNDCPNIVALKHASSNLDIAKQVLEETQIQVFSGEDGLLKEGLDIGMHGIVSVVGQLIPSCVKDVLTGEGDDQKLKQLAKICFQQSSPSDIKFLMSRLGLCADEVRLPLVKLDEHQKEVASLAFDDLFNHFDLEVF